MNVRMLAVFACAGLLALGATWAVTSGAAPAGVTATTAAIGVTSTGMRYGAPDLRSAGALTFGVDNTLFVGDSQGAAVFAIDIKDTAKDPGTDPIKVENIDRKIASLLGTTPDAIVINDLAVHPASQNVYLAVSRGRGNDAVPVILRATKQGALEEVPLKNVAFSKAGISNAPEVGSKTSWGGDKRQMTITDLAFVDGQLLVAGLSNAEFASTLRRLPFPFTQDTTVSTLEIYHTSHGKYETNSPIETFLPFTINGRPSLIAGYGCAPLASFSLADLREKKHLRGVTLAELGGGNRPVDMVAFQRDGKDRILIANSHRTLMSMSADDINKAQPLTKPMPAAYVSDGVPFLSIAVVGVTQLDNLNAKFVVMIKRDIETGSLNLLSMSKAWM